MSERQGQGLTVKVKVFSKFSFLDNLIIKGFTKFNFEIRVKKYELPFSSQRRYIQARGLRASIHNLLSKRYKIKL